MVQFTLYVLSLIAKIAAIFTTCHQMSLKCNFFHIWSLLQLQYDYLARMKCLPYHVIYIFVYDRTSQHGDSIDNLSILAIVCLTL